MTRNAATTIQNNFVGGFVTQATALDFPANAMFDQDNVVVSEVSIVSRRPGFDYENNFVTKTLSNSDKAQSTYYWKNAGGDGKTNIVVQQNGDTLYFYNTISASSLSSGISANTVTLSSFQSSGSTSANLNENECQYSTGLGYLFVVHPYCDPFYILYNPSDGSFTSAIITFQIRDIVGLPSAQLVDNRPSSLTDNHQYNLTNQGWDTALIATMHTALSTTYPSNADVWWTFKDATDVFNPSSMLASVDAGSSPAPRGYFRLNPWNTARAATALTQAGLTLTLTGTVDETSGTIRPSATEFHAGRIWYTGVKAQGYTNRIYFSKIVQSVVDFGQCLAQDDPTSSTLFDFLSSDGGIISIPQAGTIYKLVSLGPNLVVFGDNGVWLISGSVGIGFSATDYTVSSISTARSIAGTSYVQIENGVAWWNFTDINIVQSDPQTGFSVKSMTYDKIKDFYVNLDNTNKQFARGAYNARTHTVQWIYRDLPTASLNDTYAFNKVLNFNTLVGAWYTWTQPSANNYTASIVTLEGAGSLTGSNTVVDNSANTVVDNSANTVITFGFAQTTITTTTKFLVYNNSTGAFTFAECFSPAYKDWSQSSTGAEDYTSFFTTGYLVKTQGERRFQSNYIYVFNDLSSSTANAYSFQALWNYGLIASDTTWDTFGTVNQTVQTITHNETNYDAGRRRLKVRGSGTAVQFKFTSVSGKPFNIIGWSTYDTSNSAP